MSDFLVRWVILCDYVTQAIDGKYIFAGVYTEGLALFDNSPEHLGPFYACLCLRPLNLQFDLFIEMKGPDGSGIMKSSTNIKASEGSVVEEFDRVVIPVPILMARFAGFGEYTIHLGSNEGAMDLVHTFIVLPPATREEGTPH